MNTSNTATIARLLGGLDLAMAALLAYAPTTSLLDGGCAGMGTLMFCWGAAVVVGIAGLLMLLLAPRNAGRAAIWLGLLSLAATGALTLTSLPHAATSEVLLGALPALPAIAQAAFGWLLVVAQRQVVPAIA